jgi:hypothetical protein
MLAAVFQSLFEQEGRVTLGFLKLSLFNQPF